MGQAPRELRPFASTREFFGAELRHWRCARGISQARLGELTHDSGALIGRVEKGERRPSPALVRRLDDVLKTDGALWRLWRLIEHEDGQSAREAGPVPVQGDREALGLGWSATSADAADMLGELWKAHIDQRLTVVGAPWTGSAFGAPAEAWLLDRQDATVARARGRHVSKTEVDLVTTVCATFADADHHLGGGYARLTVLRYVNEVVTPLLRGSYDDATGRLLMAAASRICDLGAFMTFDSSGDQGLAQRYFIQALRLAQASGDRTLGAHILTDMAMQAHHLGDTAEALNLAEAGQQTARSSGSPATLARCYAVSARAHARRGDASACDRAMCHAESALDRADRANEPIWIRFFDERQLAAEFLYAADDLGDDRRVQRFAQPVLAAQDGMDRRRVLVTGAVASSFIHPGAESCQDVDHACELLISVIPTAGALTSKRALDSINRARRHLAPFAQRPAVQAVEASFRAAVGAAA